jgi:hypothetical protein
MHLLINVKFPNNIRKWQMGLNSAFKGLKLTEENTDRLRSLGHSERMLGNGLRQKIIQFELEVI